MSLPFTVDQFFEAFVTYNRSFWPVALVLWLASVALLAVAWRRPDRWSAALSRLLGAQWVWSGIAYHALLFTRINPAAWLFAALFVVEGVLLVSQGSRSVRYFSASSPRHRVGAGLACYALAYPALTQMFHPYPSGPTFGVPCPTAILTIGLLITARNPSWTLGIIPILWAFIGGSAAVLLNVPTDYVLLAAGVILSVTTIRYWITSTQSVSRNSP